MHKLDIKPENKLYLLSAIDTSDKLNMLLLEIRHLQQSIINNLHDPFLYIFLRHEEKYVFGGWETEEKLRKEFVNKNVSEITSKAIIRYPTPKASIDFWNSKRNKEPLEISEMMLKHIGEVWTGDVWIRGERQHYYSLMALQLLKQQVFRDKLLLFKKLRATKLIRLDKKSIDKYSLDKSAFLIFRRGVHYKIKRYIDSLKTQQQNFSKSLDFGLQRDLRPSVDRRREIGIFHDFLSNRTIDIQSDISHLISKITNKSEEEIKSNSPMLLHGWSQRMHVRNHPLWDDVGRDLGCDEKNICYIDTSFWSPDRPDLQPLVAKEIAYSTLRTITSGFSDDYFSNNFNNLTELWITLSRIINSDTDKNIGLKSIHKNSHHLVRMMVVDALASSVKGTSYLYALFLSENSSGLENLLRVNRIVRLEAIEELLSGLGSYDKYYEWYFRLKFTSFWIRKVSNFQNLPLSKIDTIVLDGTNEVCDLMLRFLDSNNISATRKAVGKDWRKLYKKIEKKVKILPILNEVYCWRECRSVDTWDDQKECSGPKKYHRATMPLDIRLRNFLFRETVKQKTQKNKLLENYSSDNLLANFCDTYGLELGEERIPYIEKKIFVSQPRNLYRQLHDIPFQCSIMRSIDFLGEKNDSPTWRSFVSQAHNDIGLGREIFSFALEFYTWRRESPKGRLLLSINLLNFVLSRLKISGSESVMKIVEIFDYWLFAGKSISSDSSNVLVNEVAGCSHQKIQRDYAQGKKGGLDEECIKKVGAVQIDDALSSGEVNGAETQRRLEQISGYKIKELSRLLESDHVRPYIDNANKLIPTNDKSDKYYIDYLSTLGDLRHFLSIRDDSESKPASLGRFYRLIFNAFDGGSLKNSCYYDPDISDCYTSVISDKQKDYILLDKLETKENLPQAIKPVIVSRLSLSNYYTISNPKKILDREKPSNVLGLYETLKRERWYRKDTSSQYSIVLGRYDVVSFTKTRLPCLCPISCFDDFSDDVANHTAAQEKFVTHFARREIALSVKLYGNYEFDSSNQFVGNGVKFNSHYVYAIASVSLQRRSMRLNLLYRLLNSVGSLDDNYSKNSIEECIRNIILWNNEEERSISISGLLTDGWGDLLLVFMVNKDIPVKAGLYERILNFQQALYEDFMVDRTELIYTPQCLDGMLKSGNYELSFLFRFQEDRKLERSLTNFVDVLKKKKPPFSNYDMSNHFSVFFTPGQYDVKVEFKIEFGEEVGIYARLLEWFADPDEELDDVYNQWYQDGLSFIDSIETRINRIKTVK